MSKAQKIGRQIFLFLCALGLALFLQCRGQVPSFTFLRHVYRIGPGSLILSAAAVFIVLNGVWALFSAGIAKAFRIPYGKALDADLPTYFPLLFFALTPLTLVHYLTFDDLRQRLGLFLTAVIFSVLYLKAVQAAHEVRVQAPPWLLWTRKFFSLSVPRRMLLLFLAALVIYNAGSVIMTSRGISFSGDEPHYLLITHSLLEDGDFDLADNYAAQDYSRYLPPGATVRAHTMPGRTPGSQYSFHSPGVSFLMLPFYALGTWLGKSALLFLVRFGMSLFGALLGVQMYLFARQEWGKERLALGIWLLFSFTSPIFFYSIHVYPEIVIALFSLTVFRLLRFSPRLSRSRLVLCGFLLFSFVWFHALKFFFILGPLFLYALWVLMKKHHARRNLVYFLGPAAIVLILYFYFQYSLYGSFNPTSVSWQGAMDEKQTVGFLKTLLTGIPFRFRLDTLLNYFLDQRDGLLFYAPIYFFAFLGLIEMVRKKSADFWLLMFITGPYVLVSAFLTQRAGYAPQARPLVAVAWGLAILLGYFLAYNGKKIFAYMMNFAIGLSFINVWLLCRNPFALYQETTSGTTERGGDLFYILSHLHFYIPNVLPSFIKVAEWRWWPNFVWPALILAFAATYLLVRKHSLALRFAQHRTLTAAGLALFFIGFAFYPRLTLGPPRKIALPSGEKMTFYSLSRAALLKEGGGFSLLEDNRDYHFYFASGKPFDKLKIEFGSLQGDYRLELKMFDAFLFADVTRKEMKDRVLESPPAYRWKTSYLYDLTVHLEKTSDVRTGVNPYALSIQPVR